MNRSYKYTPNDMEIFIRSLDRNKICEYKDKEKWRLYNILIGMLRDTEIVMPSYYNELHKKITEVCCL